MSAGDGYQPGVPCWAAAILPDAEAGLAFYTGLAPPTDTPAGRGGLLADPQGAISSVSRSPVPTPSSSRPGR
jgi:hypothetical protein